jgi:Flp pilus assembly protein CpaB
MNYRTRNIVTAGALGLLAVVFVMLYVSKVRNNEDVGKKLVSVLIAAHDIDAGTPGSALQSGAFTTKRVPQRTAVPGWLSSPTQVKGEVATANILAGEQVTTRRFGPAAATGVRSNIRGFYRVVQLAGDPNQVLDGTLKPGDRVDVLGTWTPVSCQTCKVSAVIVRDALVLSTSAELPAEGNSSNLPDSKPVQLRLTDEEANAVFWMEKNGDWSLMLRPVIKPRNNSLKYGSVAAILKSLKRRGLIQ